MRERARTTGITVSLLLIWLLSACGAGSSTASTDTTAIGSTTSTSSVTTSAPATATGTILVVGDWGSGTAPQGAVAGAMQRYAEQNEVTALLTTGDNFYSDDAEFLMHPYGWMEEAGTPWWITWGNHDVETPTRIEAINDVFDDPPRWTSIDWGDVKVVILDSTQVDSPEQEDFLSDTLADGDDPTIVVLHHPPHSCESHADPVDTQDVFVPTFDDDVFLVLSGHEHNYQRFEAEGVSYVITGGGGAGLTEFSECAVEGPEMVAGEVLHHFLALSNTGDGTLEMQAIDVNGTVLDEVTLTLP